MGTRRNGIAASAMALALLAVPASAGEFNPLGDGSDYNNADLTSDPTAVCENCRATPPYEWGDAPFDLDWSSACVAASRMTAPGPGRATN